MRVLIAPESFSGTLTAAQAAAAVAAGWREHADDDLDLCPLSDGGPGFVDVVHAARGGRLLSVTAPGPLGGATGDVVPATVLVDGATAYVEAAQVCGRHLIEDADPTRTTSEGLAPLLTAALEAGCRRVVVGAGDLAVLDGGRGLLRALGAGDDMAGLPAVRDSLAGIELVAAGDTDPPLLGFSGAAATQGTSLGATPQQAQDIDRALGEYAAAALEVLGAPQRLVAEPGAGAGGGLVFGLTLLGARREPGAQAVMDAVRFAERLRAADLVVTGEGLVDWRSLRGAVVAAVAHHGLAAAVPVVVLAGQVELGRRELLSIGVESSYPVAEGHDQVTAALADPVGTLQARARRVARTWSR